MIDDEKRRSKLKAIAFPRWIFWFFLTYALLQVAEIVLVGALFNIPLRQMAVPCLYLLVWGLVVGVLIYWARQFAENPRACAMRFAVLFFFALPVYILVVASTAIKLQILRAVWAEDLIPVVVVGAAIAAISLYRGVRRQLERPRGPGSESKVV